MPLWSPEVHRTLVEFDVLLVAGMNLLRSYIYHEPGRPIPEHIRLVQMDNDPWQIAKNYPVEVGLLGDLKAALAELDQLLARVVDWPPSDGRASAAGSLHHGAAIGTGYIEEQDNR